MKKIIAFSVAAVLMAAALAIPVLSATPADVKGHKHETAIEYCRDNKFISDATPTAFNPDAAIRRDEFVIIWGKSLQLREPRFTDIMKTSYQSYEAYAFMLYALNILDGVGVNEFGAKSYFTREQLAVITMRTYKLGALDPDDYKFYDDHASVSNWAQTAVSACLNAKVFAGLYEGPKFEPKKAVTRAEICQIIYNINHPHTPPAPAALTSIKVKTPPDKVLYKTSESLDLTGLVVTAAYSDGGTKDVTGYTTSITGGTALDTAGTVTVTVSYTEKGVTKTDTFDITVEESAEPVTLTSITVMAPPDKVSYGIGRSLDLTGLAVIATYSDGGTSLITGYSTSPANGATLLIPGTRTVTVSYTEGGITKTDTFSITVSVSP